MLCSLLSSTELSNKVTISHAVKRRLRDRGYLKNASTHFNSFQRQRLENNQAMPYTILRLRPLHYQQRSQLCQAGHA